MDEFAKVGAEMSYFQSQVHCDDDSAESMADSDLEDGELRKMSASPLYLENREDCESSRMPIAPVKLAALFFERSKYEASSSCFQKKLDVKFVSGTESAGETCCVVFIGKRRTGKSIQEFCFQKR